MAELETFRNDIQDFVYNHQAMAAFQQGVTRTEARTAVIAARPQNCHRHFRVRQKLHPKAKSRE
jgi:hypothetical protein